MKTATVNSLIELEGMKPNDSVFVGVINMRNGLREVRTTYQGHRARDEVLDMHSWRMNARLHLIFDSSHSFCSRNLNQRTVRSVLSIHARDESFRE